jgi:hypothetical protein
MIQVILVNLLSKEWESQTLRVHEYPLAASQRMPYAALQTPMTMGMSYQILFFIEEQIPFLRRTIHCYFQECILRSIHFELEVLRTNHAQQL